MNTEKDQLGLFDVPPPPATEQEKQVERVRGKIQAQILAWFQQHPVGHQFRLIDLTVDIARKVPSLAPDSPGRILRLLRGEGILDYKVVSRAQSLYEITEVPE